MSFQQGSKAICNLKKFPIFSVTAIIFILFPAIKNSRSCKVKGKEVYGVATAFICLSLKCMADAGLEQGGVE